MTRMIAAIRTWGEMIKFSHSLFALPFAVLATFLAARPSLPSPTQIGLIVVCMIAARSAAMTFNRIIDAAIDAQNPRTAGRQIPAGVIGIRSAWIFFVLACVLFVGTCSAFWLLAGNPWPVMLSLPTLALLCFYSYTKRFTRFSHLVLGTAIAFSPVAAWIAISPLTLGAAAWLLMLAVMFWIAGFDIIYACQDADFDRSTGLYSLPATIGVAAALWTARAFHMITVAALVLVGIAAQLGAYYHAGVACVVVLLVVENALVSPRNLSRVNIAFFTVNGVVGLLLGGLGVVDVWMHLPPS